MNLTTEEQALLDARREKRAAGDALETAYVVLRSSIECGDPALAQVRNLADFSEAAEAFDVACHAHDAAVRAAYDRRTP